MATPSSQSSLCLPGCGSQRAPPPPASVLSWLHTVLSFLLFWLRRSKVGVEVRRGRDLVHHPSASVFASRRPVFSPLSSSGLSRAAGRRGCSLSAGMIVQRAHSEGAPPARPFTLKSSFPGLKFLLLAPAQRLRFL